MSNTRQASLLTIGSSLVQLVLLRWSKYFLYSSWPASWVWRVIPTHSSQPVHIDWDNTMTGPSVNNNYNNILAELGWPIKNGELSSQLAGQQWVKSLKGLLLRQLTREIGGWILDWYGN